MRTPGTWKQSNSSPKHVIPPLINVFIQKHVQALVVPLIFFFKLPFQKMLLCTYYTRTLFLFVPEVTSSIVQGHGRAHVIQDVSQKKKKIQIKCQK